MLKRLYWVYPDRCTAAQKEVEEEAVWGPYRKIAATTFSLDFELIKPEDISIDLTSPEEAKVYVLGDRVTPQDTIFVTALYSLPYHAVDVWNQVALFTNLDELGFYLPIDPRTAYMSEDKCSTIARLAGCPVQPLPTVRIPSGRDAMSGHFDVALEELDYPMIVKPISWGMGLGVTVVTNPHDLKGMVGLAGASDIPLVAQPYFQGASEARVYVVDGEAHTTLVGKKDGYCLPVARKHGGSTEWSFRDFPPELTEAIHFIAERVPIPYFTADFIHDGENYWFSELEVDGALPFHGTPEQVRIATDVVEARFNAYVQGHSHAS